ncbi:MAG: hydrogenobyrinic acid a,c-diamide synthase (glutamine-hydrolyzing) [Desulfotalea sp.]
MKSTKAFVVTGLSGGSGKSVVSVGLAAYFTRKGRSVVPFKKGPDYIDAGWLQEAAGSSCYNLDPYLMTEQDVQDSFYSRCQNGEVAVVEGNRGLYDGVNVDGGFSTAELAINLNLPVVLVVNCSKTTRTIAALVLGCKLFDERINIKGVILNQIATKRQKKLVSEAVEKYTGIPILGCIPRTKKEVFPMRHLGMVPHQEYQNSDEAVSFLADLVEEHLDMDLLEEIMVDIPHSEKALTQTKSAKPKIKIGVIRDAAFQFYYSENLEALEAGGAELVYLDAIKDKCIPKLDGLYIGGGFPETGAELLAANKTFLKSIKDGADAGLPIYAECGGLMYLGEVLEIGGKEYNFTGVFPVRFGMSAKPQAHGYSIFNTELENPYYPVGCKIKGHEFRYSKVLSWSGNTKDLCVKVERGTGFMDGRDGLVYKNVLAMYTHVHAEGSPEWSEGFLKKCYERKS